MMHDLFILAYKYGGLMVCTVIMMACICRIDMLNIKVTHLDVSVMYTLYALYGGGVAIDLLINRVVDWYEAAGMAGILIHILHTRKKWKDGPPQETVRGEP